MKYLAQDIGKTFGTILPPDEIKGLGPGPTGINRLLDNMVGIFFTAGAMAFIIMFVWGAVQMILSGGDKEVIAKARSKITWSIVGVALLASSYLIFLLLQYITGFRFFATGFP